MGSIRVDDEVADTYFLTHGMFVYGKYAGEAVADVARADSAYVKWALVSQVQLALTKEDVEVLRRAVELTKIVEEGLANGGQMVSIEGNGGRIVGGGGPAAPMMLLTPPPIPPEPCAHPPNTVCVDCDFEVESPPTDQEACAGTYGTLPDIPPQLPPLPEPPPIPSVDGLSYESLIASRPPIVWTDEQQEALQEIDDWYYGDESFFALTGPAGTGKSTLIREVAERYPGLGLTAMTGKAALRLAECAGRGASTLHKVLYYPPTGGQTLKFTRLREPISRLLAVDESSMMTPSVYEDLKRWDYGMRYLLVGDSYQLPPVITEKSEIERFGEDFSVFGQVPGVALKTVMRNSGGVLEAATHVRETGSICERSIPDDNGGYEFLREVNPLKRAVDDYLNDRDDHFLITWTNSLRMSANARIRELLGLSGGGPLPDAGEHVLIKKNGQGYMNGEIVTCGGFEAGPMIGSVKTMWMKVVGAAAILVSYEGGGPRKKGEFFDGQMPWIENWKAFQIEIQKGTYPDPIPVTWAYCLTAHSAQGSQARRVTVFLNRADVRSGYFNKPTTLPNGDKAKFSSRFIYTAITRSKKRTTMIVGR